MSLDQAFPLLAFGERRLRAHLGVPPRSHEVPPELLNPWHLADFIASVSLPLRVLQWKTQHKSKVVRRQGRQGTPIPIRIDDFLGSGTIAA